MHTQVRLLSLLCLLLIPLTGQAQQLAFPSAEGFGRFASGGRGGSVCKVTTLTDSGAGSLRACLGQSGPRTIVFAVSGLITLTSAITSIPDHVTIACQSAPGQGVLIKGSLKFWNTENVIMRFCRLRSPPPVDATWAVGMSMVAPYVAANTMIFDHLSLGWYYDDMLGFTLPSVPASHPLNATVQWSIFSESTASPAGEAGGSRGATGGGVYNATGVMNVSWLYNLYSNVGKRTPHPGSGSRHQVVNQVLHNLNTSAFESIYILARFQPTIANIIGNWFRSGGPNTWPVGVLGCGWPGYACNATAERGSNIYLKGNLDTLKRPNTATGNELAVAKLQNADNFTVQSTTPNSGFPTLPSQTTAEQAFAMVMANVGAHKPFRDAIDQRAISDATNDVRRGACSPTPGALCFHYPTYAPGTVPPDTDNDGMPDSWETAHGLNPALASDGPSIAPNGYSNLENYLNTLAGDTVLTPPAGPVFPPTSCVATVGPATGPSPAPQGRVAHVAVTGDDAHDGSSSRPFRTITRGAKALSPGATLLIHPGTYRELLHNVIPGGQSWQQPVTLQAVQRGTVTLIPPRSADMVVSFGHRTTQYIVLDGLKIDAQERTAFGIYISDEAHHIRIQHTEIFHTRSNGILVTSGRAPGHTKSCCNEFRHLNIHDTGTGNSGHSIYVSTSNNVIEHSRFHHSNGYCIHYYSSFGGVNHNVARGNIVHNCNQRKNAAAVILGSGTNNSAINNLIYDSGSGLTIASSGAKVFHNTILNNNRPAPGNDSIGIIANGSGQVRNNIILGHTITIWPTAARLSLAHNQMSGDPQFVNLSTRDLRLRASSPAVNAGATLAEVADDLVGTRRPQGGQVDLGAYEFTTAASPAPCLSPPPPPPLASLPAPRNLRVLREH